MDLFINFQKYFLFCLFNKIFKINKYKKFEPLVYKYLHIFTHNIILTQVGSVNPFVTQRLQQQEGAQQPNRIIDRPHCCAIRLHHRQC